MLDYGIGWWDKILSINGHWINIKSEMKTTKKKSREPILQKGQRLIKNNSEIQAKKNKKKKQMKIVKIPNCKSFQRLGPTQLKLTLPQTIKMENSSLRNFSAQTHQRSSHNLSVDRLYVFFSQCHKPVSINS